MSIRTCPHCESPIALHLTRCNYCDGRLEDAMPNLFNTTSKVKEDLQEAKEKQSSREQSASQQPKARKIKRRNHQREQNQGQYQQYHQQEWQQGQFQQQHQQSEWQQGHYRQYTEYQQHEYGQIKHSHVNVRVQYQSPPPPPPPMQSYDQGYWQGNAGPYVMQYRNPKNKYIAALLAFFFGSIGLHKFYLRRPGWGIIYILFIWTYIPFVVSILEALYYLLVSKEEFHRKYSR